MKISNNRKFQPFAPINEQHQAFNKLVKETEKEPMKKLDDLEIEELSLTIGDAYRNGEQIEITYYNDGYYIKSKGIVSKVDPIQRSIELKNDSKEKIFFEKIIEAKIL